MYIVFVHNNTGGYSITNITRFVVILAVGNSIAHLSKHVRDKQKVTKTKSESRNRHVYKIRPHYLMRYVHYVTVMRIIFLARTFVY